MSGVDVVLLEEWSLVHCSDDNMIRQEMMINIYLDPASKHDSNFITPPLLQHQSTHADAGSRPSFIVRVQTRGYN